MTKLIVLDATTGLAHLYNVNTADNDAIYERVTENYWGDAVYMVYTEIIKHKGTIII